MAAIFAEDAEDDPRNDPAEQGSRGERDMPTEDDDDPPEPDEAARQSDR